MSGNSNMFMYSLTVLQPSAITQAILGAFSGKKQQEIIVAQGSRLSLLRPDPAQGKVHSVLTIDVFGIIRCLAAFRLAGSSKGMFLSSFFSMCPRYLCSIVISGSGIRSAEYQLEGGAVGSYVALPEDC